MIIYIYIKLLLNKNSINNFYLVKAFNIKKVRVWKEKKKQEIRWRMQEIVSYIKISFKRNEDEWF